jgi:hypothetical protein
MHKVHPHGGQDGVIGFEVSQTMVTAAAVIFVLIRRPIFLGPVIAAK